MSSIGRILAIGGRIFGDIEMGRAIGRRWLARLGYCSGGRAPTRRRRDHHNVRWTVGSLSATKVEVVHLDEVDMSGIAGEGGLWPMVR